MVLFVSQVTHHKVIKKAGKILVTVCFIILQKSY